MSFFASFPSDDEPEGEACPRLHILGDEDYWVAVAPGRRWPMGDAVRFCTGGARNMSATFLVAALFQLGRGKLTLARRAAQAFLDTTKDDDA